MALLINKDGKQLGPYSLEEARALVLSGQVTARDWAWPDGSTEWIKLKDVPGFSTADPGPAAPPEQPPAPAAPVKEEEELWRGHPAQVLNLKIYVVWAIIVAGSLVAAVSPIGPQEWRILGLGIVGIIALIHVIVSYFQLRSIEYVVTTQRVRVISGIFSKEIQEIELFRVKDTAAQQSFFLRLFGLGTITIISGDERHPHIVLSAVPRAIELREKLREEVMSLRQRFGVRELDVM
jgi:membrane protein YdbS with pleckstrin-like domain